MLSWKIPCVDPQQGQMCPVVPALETKTIYLPEMTACVWVGILHTVFSKSYLTSNIVLMTAQWSWNNNVITMSDPKWLLTLVWSDLYVTWITGTVAASFETRGCLWSQRRFTVNPAFTLLDALVLNMDFYINKMLSMHMLWHVMYTFTASGVPLWPLRPTTKQVLVVSVFYQWMVELLLQNVFEFCRSQLFIQITCAEVKKSSKTCRKGCLY